MTILQLLLTNLNLLKSSKINLGTDKQKRKRTFVDNLGKIFLTEKNEVEN